MKSLFNLTFLFFIFSTVSAQVEAVPRKTDTLFRQTDTLFMNNEKIACNVKEITADAVKFSYPKEELVNSVYKNSVQKIVFASGRVQTFSESTSFKKVEGVEDFDKVTITGVEGEIKGLFKIGEVSAKAKGTTALSNQERVKERAYRKLKIQAAMRGANIVYLTNQRSEGNKLGGYYQSGSSAETSLSGIAYSNQLPDFNEFKSLIGNKTDFIATGIYKLWASDSDYSKTSEPKQFVVNSITNENGLIMIDGNLKDVKGVTRFQVASFTKDSFHVFYETKSTVFNVEIGF